MEKLYSRFYKCALQVNPYSYSTYRGEEGYEESEYNEEIVRVCKEEDIKIVGLADHGDVNSSDSLREKLEDNGIIVFPGFEICTAEKIHMVCLFDSKKTNSELNQILGSIGMSNKEAKTDPSSKTFIDIAKEIIDHDGFYYAAHITSDNGILKIGQLQNVWTHKYFTVAQIPNTRDKIDPNYKNIINNKEGAYKRDNPVAFINAKDISKPSDLTDENATTLVKLSKLDFQSFKDAFKDPDSRIKLNGEKKELYKSYIKSIKITGGYLDGFSVCFPEELTTIIGGRGTGKSTLINLIRYVLGTYKSKKSQDEVEDMMKKNLAQSGEVEMKICSYTQQGQEYTLIKRYNQNLVIKDDSGRISKFTVEDILPNIEIYGQNEIIEMLSDQEVIYNIVERLLLIDDKLIKDQEEKYNNLKGNRKDIENINRSILSLENELGNIDSVKEKLLNYNKFGIGEKLSLINAQSKEKSVFEEVITKLKEIEISKIKVDKVDIETKETPKVNDIIKEFNDNMDTYINRLEEYKNDTIEKLKRTYEVWNIEQKEINDEIQRIVKNIDGIHDKTNEQIAMEYKTLSDEINKSSSKEARLKQLKSGKTSLLEERKNLIEDCKISNGKLDEYIFSRVKKLNKKELNRDIEISILPRQNLKDLKTELLKLEGIGDKSLEPLDEIEAFDVFTFIEDINAKKNEEINNKYKLRNVAIDSIKNMDELKKFKLEEMILGNITIIKLKVGNEFKVLESLSKGQQCTAILNILLVKNKDPLIIDQPEDNLDNAFIAESLVSELRKHKVSRQYILATHNANIPVFGDAELIITLIEEEKNGRIADNGIGSIDSEDVKKHVINILEGGKDAFLIREKKYNIQ
ncbi:TrlF family AAA-like ATPase [Anaerosphaera multitolerans]|uniref:Rad50/SbcC-type AAA domain-containing protein n=1 Tax=Anaerosphaera multitolerans TaxID=2487351 RepID=A0A437S8L0_9FIRM|nr:hypothetical protein [Anaerosphaera multitolerans]RVU55436.1 hypothetical protein EF514_01520 [Anaerosphaera multitolerans]